jgi:hypothetical protein
MFIFNHTTVVFNYELQITNYEQAQFVICNS